MRQASATSLGLSAHSAPVASKGAAASLFGVVDHQVVAGRLDVAGHVDAHLSDADEPYLHHSSFSSFLHPSHDPSDPKPSSASVSGRGTAGLGIPAHGLRSSPRASARRERRYRRRGRRRAVRRSAWAGGSRRARVPSLTLKAWRRVRMRLPASKPFVPVHVPARHRPQQFHHRRRVELRVERAEAGRAQQLPVGGSARVGLPLLVVVAEDLRRSRLEQGVARPGERPGRAWPSPCGPQCWAGVASAM